MHCYIQLFVLMFRAQQEQRGGISLRLAHERIEQSFHSLRTLLGKSLLTIVVVDKSNSKSSLETFSPLETAHR